MDVQQLSFALVLSFCLAQAELFAGPRTILEEDQALYPEKEWRSYGRAADHARTRVVFALKHSNVDKLTAIFHALSSPKSRNYGRFLSNEHLAKLISPSADAQDDITAWLELSGVDVSSQCRWTQAREFLSCDLAVGVVRELLGVDLSVYRHHTHRHLSVIRAASHYSLPSEVAEHVDFVGGLHRFPDLRRMTKLIPNVTNLTGLAAVTPARLRSLYKVESSVGSDNTKNIQGVAQFLNQHYKASDLEKFFQEFGSGFKHLTSVAKVIGPNSGTAGIEASLDIEYIMALGANIPTYFWSTGGHHEGQEPFLEWIMLVANTSTVPWVMSISYGDYEDSLSKAYMIRINEEFQKQGIRGLSIIFASGDDGAGCHMQKFRPNFPATSPFVTAVGATEDFSESGEQAVGFSSGGFSNVFSDTSYQKSAVEEFFETSKKLPAQHYYNKSGRGFPDVAALGVGFSVVTNGHIASGVAGTSCSAPTFAGIMALINDELIVKHGKKPLGFLNPFLYQHASALKDIEEGCNEGCGFLDQGFCAEKGWDPVTGLGTPNYPELLQAALTAKGVFRYKHQ